MDSFIEILIKTRKGWNYMRILLVHLSDIHLNTIKNSVMSKVDSIISAIQSNAVNVSTCFAIVTGDIANKGKEEEYLCAVEFFDVFEKLKKPIGPFENVHLIFSPGNHDCNFQFDDGLISESTRNSLIDTYLLKQTVDNATINICTSVQKNFDNFRHACSGLNCTISGNKLHRTETYTINNKAILFQIFNTAWMSKIKEIPGTISLPLQFLTPVDPTNYYTVISIFHHPLHWLQPDNRSKFKKLIESTSDIIITGHEHAPEGYILDNTEVSNQYYAGGVLQDPDDSNNSSFNIIGLDLDNNLEMVEQYTYDSSSKIYKPSRAVQEWNEFKRNKYIKNKLFEFNESF